VRRLNPGIFTAAFAIAFGVIVLLGYFVQIPLLVTLRVLFLRWAVALSAVALIVGLINLARVHWRRMTGRQPGGFYSLVLLLALAGTLIVGGVFGPTQPWSMWIFNSIQAPVESSLMALLAVVLAYAAARLLSRRMNTFSVLFVVTALLVLAGSITLPFLQIPELNDLRNWISQVPAAAGARGLLLGVALGTVATALRVLTGADRPYGS